MTTARLCRLAPAKINIRLRIIGRRTDGYHLLDSLMVPISLCDELTLQISRVALAGRAPSTIVVSSDSDDAPGGPSNLAYRAAELFLEEAGRFVDVRIHITKRIPVGSGLGGGSSDAAAVLRVLNEHVGAPYTIAQLAALGARIGADVPFFVYGCSAHVEGIGEYVTPIKRRGEPIPLVVCFDGQGLSTKLVYSKVDLSLTTHRAGSNMSSLVMDRESITGLLANDLEIAAAQIRPEVLLLKARLLGLGACGALMTGSGSAVFGVFADVQQAQRAAATLHEEGLWAAAVQTLDDWPGVIS